MCRLFLIPQMIGWGGRVAKTTVVPKGFDLLDGCFRTGEKRDGEAGTEVADGAPIVRTQAPLVPRHDDQGGAFFD